MTARKINFWLMLLWVVPGIPISYLLRQSLPWIVFLSVYAIIVSHAAAWRADVPIDKSQK